MVIGEEFSIFSWFKIHFVENEGMAFGMTLGGEYGKLILSLFRIVAVVFIIAFLRGLIQNGAKKGLVVSISLILAGAIGNIIDSTIYGLIFSDSFGQVATFMPEGGGYATIFHGRVVDMFYFPLYSGFLPEWVPYWGGKYFTFFRPVFNIADSAITVGVLSIIIFQRSFFTETGLGETTAETAETETPAVELASEGIPANTELPPVNNTTSTDLETEKDN